MRAMLMPDAITFRRYADAFDADAAHAYAIRC